MEGSERRTRGLPQNKTLAYKRSQFLIEDKVVAIRGLSFMHCIPNDTQKSKHEHELKQKKSQTVMVTDIKAKIVRPQNTQKEEEKP